MQTNLPEFRKPVLDRSKSSSEPANQHLLEQHSNLAFSSTLNGPAQSNVAVNGSPPLTSPIAAPVAPNLGRGDARTEDSLRRNQKKGRQASFADNKDVLSNEQKHIILREYFNDVRISIDYSIIKSEGEGKLIIITSALQSEGKTFCAINLASSFASVLDKRVLLVDCDLHAPKVHRRLHIPNQPGLTDYLLKQSQFKESSYYNTHTNLHVMTSGTRVPNPTVFLSGQPFRNFLDEMREKFDYVIIDTPPVLQSTDASSFAAHTDGVALVTRSNQSTVPDLRAALETLNKAQANILGIILNDADYTKKAFGYAYYYAKE